MTGIEQTLTDLTDRNQRLESNIHQMRSQSSTIKASHDAEVEKLKEHSEHTKVLLFIPVRDGPL